MIGRAIDKELEQFGAIGSCSHFGDSGMNIVF